MSCAQPSHFHSHLSEISPSCDVKPPHCRRHVHGAETYRRLFLSSVTRGLRCLPHECAEAVVRHCQTATAISGGCACRRMSGTSTGLACRPCRTSSCPRSSARCGNTLLLGLYAEHLRSCCIVNPTCDGSVRSFLRLLRERWRHRPAEGAGNRGRRCRGHGVLGRRILRVATVALVVRQVEPELASL